MNCCEFAPPYVRAIAPYQPGKPISELARELGLDEADIVKLASNENPLGPSPMALAAAQDALHDMALYPDGAGFALKAKLSAKLGVAARQIVLGNGSNDILEMAARAFLIEFSVMLPAPVLRRPAAIAAPLFLQQSGQLWSEA